MIHDLKSTYRHDGIHESHKENDQVIRVIREVVERLRLVGLIDLVLGLGENLGLCEGYQRARDHEQLESVTGYEKISFSLRLKLTPCSRDDVVEVEERLARYSLC